MMVRIVASIFLLVLLFFPLGRVANAQEELPDGPIYIVQEGDTLWDIALRFGVSWEDLANENGISDPGQLSAGDEIVIPGLDGLGQVLVTTPVALGENLRSISRSYQIPEETIIKLNHLTSPGDLFLGYNLVIPEGNQRNAAVERYAVGKGQSLLELAIMTGVNPWRFVRENNLQSSWGVVPGDVLINHTADAEPGPGGLPGGLKSIAVSPDQLMQGKTAVVKVTADEEMVLSGSLLDYQLNFFQDVDGEFSALQGIHALTEPGYYPLLIQGELDDHIPFGFTQFLYVAPGEYTYKSLQVPAETIDPEVTVPEDEEWIALAEPVSPEKLWQGVFERPVAPSECGYTDTFGHRRSYNGSPYNYFHTGLDFCYNYNNEINEIYAPADGVVVFAGPLVVRGNAVMIDHGRGIYSGYMHQEEIKVAVGDVIETGQVIGIVGGTGRVNGPHLHLEIWVGGVQVDPEDWLEIAYP